MGDWMQQSFFFDWTPTTYPTPVPITAQCETIQIEWSRGTATGPDPVAPYFLEIYTSHYVFPFQIPAGSQLTTNFTVPFAPGTQYQICMFDSVGNTGGCQAVYTVYAPNTAQSMEGQCANLTFPQTSLQVQSSAGQYSWIPSCTDLTLVPQSGTPPYQVTIAPALHPPRNISNVGSVGITTKIDLQWAVPFFVGMTDSSGMSWSFGPLHAGEGSTDCLTDAKPGLAVGGAVGLAIGSLILGALLMLGIFHFFGGGSPRFRDRDTEGAPLRPYRGGESSLAPTPYLEQEGESSRSLMDGSPDYSGGLGLGYQSGTLGKKYTTASTSSYRIEPFDPNSVQLQREPTTSPRESRVGNDGSRSSQVYVVHHDGGPPPVSIYTGDGTQVVELPPAYRGGAGGSGQPSTSSSGSTDPAATPSRTPRNLPPGAATPEFIVPYGVGRQVSAGGGSEKSASRPRSSPRNPD